DGRRPRRSSGEERIDKMRRKIRQRVGRAGEGRVELAAVGVGGAVMGQAERGEAGARWLGGVAVAVAARRALRHYGEGNGFAEGDTAGRLAEVDAARGADSLDVATERCEVEIGLQDVVLGVSGFEPGCGRDLAKLSRGSACV